MEVYGKTLREIGPNETHIIIININTGTIIDPNYSSSGKTHFLINILKDSIVNGKRRLDRKESKYSDLTIDPEELQRIYSSFKKQYNPHEHHGYSLEEAMLTLRSE